MDTAQAGHATKRRDAILEAVAFAAERLLLVGDWREVAAEVMTRLGRAAEVSRAYVIENEWLGADLQGRWVAEWTDGGLQPLTDNPDVRDAPWRGGGFGRWADALAAGREVIGLVDDLPPSEADPLRSHRVASIAVLPVMADGQWVGSVGFDAPHVREWDPPELEALRTAARLIGAAFERQRRDEEARQTERGYQTFTERIPAVIYASVITEGEDTTRIGFVSPQIAEILGYPPQSFLDDAKFWHELIHPEDLSGRRGAMSSHDSSPFEGEYRMRSSEGAWVWVHDTSTAVPGPDGETQFFLGFLTDVTTRREAERRAREAEERSRLMFENMPAIAYQEPPTPEGEAYDPTSSKWYVSPQVHTRLGYTSEEMSVAGFWAKATHPEDFHAVVDESQLTARTGQPFRMDYRMIAKDGRVVWFHDESVLVRDEAGRPIGWQGIIVDVTERREAEVERAASEHRYRSLVDHGPDGIIVRVDDRFVFANPRAAEILGADDPSSLIGLPLLDIAHPSHHEVIRKRIAAQDRGEVAPLMQQLFIRRDGTPVDVEVVGIPITWEGQPASQIVFRDISERVAAERQLREAEEKFRTIVEQNPAVIYRQEFAPDDVSISRTTYVSPRQTELLGFTVDEVIADPMVWARQIHPEDRDRFLQADLESNMRADPSFSMEYRMLTKDGRVVWVQDEAKLVHASDGPPFWQGFLLDITQRKMAEKAVHDSNKRMGQVIDTALDAVVSMSAAGIITGWNPQAETTFGWSKNQAIGRSLAETIVPEGLREAHAAGLRRYLATGEGPVLGKRMEIQALHRDGREFPVELSIVPLRLGDEISFSAFVRDISDRKIAERELERSLATEREAAGRLRDIDEMKNTFLQAVSHDLRTPLSSILGLAITLEREDMHLSPEDSRDLAGRIAGNAKRLVALVSNLLDMDRLARGIVEPSIELGDVSAVVRHVLDDSGSIPMVRLRTELPELIVPMDAAKVERIVENLLANTARHAPPDATVWVSVRTEDDGVLLLVEDDGPGVPADMRDAIFEPFRQGSDKTPHSPGVGVGLALVRSFADLHGGKAWVEEREGGGASFRVWLPMATADVAAARAV